MMFLSNAYEYLSSIVDNALKNYRDMLFMIPLEIKYCIYAKKSLSKSYTVHAVLNGRKKDRGNIKQKYKNYLKEKEHEMFLS